MGHGYMRDFDEDRGDMRERRRDEGQGRSGRDRSFMLGDQEREWARSPRGVSSRQDDHYLSWRDKQIQALDRDYADYCRERERQFHSDFDAWRNQRLGNQQPLQTGMTQTSQSGDPTGELELSNEMVDPRQTQPDPMDAATLGTTSGRRRG
jgi:hypothetical protein